METVLSDKVPAAWFPNGRETLQRYRGPKIKFSEHYNCDKAEELWVKWKRAEYWCSGKGLEYGHTMYDEPHVRLVYMGSKGKSMWYPLYQAAKMWNAQCLCAKVLY